MDAKTEEKTEIPAEPVVEFDGFPTEPGGETETESHGETPPAAPESKPDARDEIEVEFEPGRPKRYTPDRLAKSLVGATRKLTERDAELQREREARIRAEERARTFEERANAPGAPTAIRSGNDPNEVAALAQAYVMNFSMDETSARLAADKEVTRQRREIERDEKLERVLARQEALERAVPAAFQHMRRITQFEADGFNPDSPEAQQIWKDLEYPCVQGTNQMSIKTVYLAWKAARGNAPDDSGELEDDEDESLSVSKSRMAPTRATGGRRKAPPRSTEVRPSEMTQRDRVRRSLEQQGGREALAIFDNFGKAGR